MVAEIRLAIEATTRDDWKSERPGVSGIWTFRVARSEGWVLLIGYGGGRQDGTATKGTTIVHLPTELAVLARKKAEGI